MPTIRKYSAKWIQQAVKRPGRVLELTNSKPGELTITKINAKLKELEAKEKKSETDKKDIKALNMAKTLVRNKGWKGE
jgi:hypothetical protein